MSDFDMNKKRFTKHVL